MPGDELHDDCEDLDPADECLDLLDAASANLEFWDNSWDDEDWNRA